MHPTGLSLKTHEGRLLVSEVPKAQLRSCQDSGREELLEDVLGVPFMWFVLC